ncbi:MAG: DNA primase [Phycisphaerae bacterium]|nr:DNA primase [Phycisphaerae bacterium]
MASQKFSDLTERIRQASDIVDVISSFVSLKRSGSNFKGLCPFHNEKTPSFSVQPEKQIFHCFGCGQGGDVFKFIQAKEGISFSESIEYLAQRAGIEIERPKPRDDSRRSDEPGKSDLERVNRWALRWFQKQLWESTAGQGARHYVETRGINTEFARSFAIGFAPESWDALRNSAAAAEIPTEWLAVAGLLRRREDGTTYDAFRNRLIFPIFDSMNRVVGFGGRALGDDPAKYVNSPQNLLFDKSRCLFGIQNAKDPFARTRVAVVVEGYIDCLLAQQHGFGHTVATLGTALTAEHARLLRRYVDRVTLVFDSDDAGRKAADRSLGVFISERLDVRLSHVPKGKDPADLLVSEGAKSFEAVLTSAVDALEFKWNQVRHRYRGAESGVDRMQAMEEYLSLVASSADFGAIVPIQRGLILNQVGKLLGLSIDEVNRQMRIVSRRNAPVAGPAAMPSRTVRTRGERTTVVREIVSVLLNAPELHESIAADFDAADVDDPVLRDIIVALKEMLADEAHAFDVSRLIGRFESTEAARLIARMYAEGDRCGNHEASLAHCMERLAEIRDAEYRERLLAELKSKESSKALMEEASLNGCSSATQDAQRAMAVAITDVSRRVSHFAPRKYLAGPPIKGAD